MIVTDENGKRRFHGAFTGGFSAGYWNTVGSQEGWTPQSFKSSRSEKAQRQQQKPEDFMDEEDKGEFGIAAKRLQTHADFADESAGEKPSRKRKFMQPNEILGGMMAGAVALQDLLQIKADKVAVRILKSMGWREGQGIGSRQTGKEKKKAKLLNMKEKYLREHYGYDKKAKEEESNEEESEDEDDAESILPGKTITFAPEDFDEPMPSMKMDRFGLSYSGLNRDPVLASSSSTTTSSSAGAAVQKRFNLFETFEVLDKNKKFSISGQAFGVGALEDDDDEDIYARDDLTKYDFSLEHKKQPKKKQKDAGPKDMTVLDGFVKPQNKMHTPVFDVTVPRDWQPRNWAVRKSRFSALDPRRERQISSLKAEDTEMKPLQRGTLLGEQVNTSTKLSEIKERAKPSISEMQAAYKSREQRSKELLERITAKSSNFTIGGIITDKGEEKSEKQESKRTDSLGMLNKYINKSHNIRERSLERRVIWLGHFK